MPDAGTRYTDKKQGEIERRLRSVYRQAQKEIVEKLDAQTKRMNAQDVVKRAQLEAGKITQQQYNSWLQGQMFTQQQWKNKVDSVTSTLLHANEQANAIIEGERRAVFGENATYTAYDIEKGVGLDLGFTLYDSATVTRLLRDQPELLPRREVDGVKDKAWNRKQIANAVTQGIIQGESIPEIADRIAKQTSSTNEKAMIRYARTAMTGAQNAGRVCAMHDAIDKGVKVKKRWEATLDNRTRDAHADLDGQEQDVDDPFDSELGPIDYPGDPNAEQENVWNCRCTLTWTHPEYPMQNVTRHDNVDGVLIEDMSYNEWQEAKHPEEYRKRMERERKRKEARGG